MGFKKLIMVPLLLALMVVSVVGCGGAGVPAPPVELPTPILIKFVQYEDIRIDFSKISAAPTAASLSKYVGVGGEFSDVIAEGPAQESLHTAALQALLNVIRDIEVPVGNDVTTFALTDYDLWAKSVKIDFRIDIDIDGDGVLEGCSGHTGALPVCALVWVNDQRFIAAVFDTYPYETGTNPGRGRFKISVTQEQLSSVLDALVGVMDQETINLLRSVRFDTSYYAVHYDHDDMLNRQTEVFRLMDGLDPVDIFGTTYAQSYGVHLEARQVGEPASAQKLLNFRFDSVSTAESGETLGMFFKYLGQYRGDQDFWSGSWDDQLNYYIPLSLETIFGSGENVCARISTGNAVEPELAGICNDSGISVAGIPFVSQTQESDVLLPSNFPATPTF